MKRIQYRQLLLFLVALILPSLVIARLGWTVMRQSQEIESERAGKQRAQDAARMGDLLLSRLDGIGNTAPAGAAAPTESVLFVGWLDDQSGLVLPWEVSTRLAPGAQRSDLEFRLKMANAGRADREGNFELAATSYSDAAEMATSESDFLQARRKQAESLKRLGAPARERGVYRGLLDLPSSRVDEEGDSLAYFGARLLLRMDAKDPATIERVQRDLSEPSVLTPRVTRNWIKVLSELTENPATHPETSEVWRQLSDRRQYLEQAAKLQAGFSTLGVKPTTWQYWANDGSPWLVGMDERAESRPVVVVVRATDVFESVQSNLGSAENRIEVMDGGNTGLPLGERLPGLRVVTSGTAATAGDGPNLRPFFGLSLSVVLGLTFIAGYLLWRDTRRETRHAELRSQFVSSVSHELKTPLTSIRMFADLLQMQDAVQTKTHADYLNMIANESERLTRLLNNVLDFSRIEHGQKNYHMEPTRLDEVVTAAARTMEYPLAEQGFHLSVDADGQIPTVAADRDALKQAVLNLLTNAMKYSGKSREIELRLHPENGSAVIQVSDHGIGIPAKEQARIFEKFYRANVPENRAISGTGLGLALVAHIAEAHRGKIEVQSALGQGTTFSIHIPIHAGGES